MEFYTCTGSVYVNLDALFHILARGRFVNSISSSTKCYVKKLHHSPSHFPQDFLYHFLQYFPQNFPQHFLQMTCIFWTFPAGFPIKKMHFWSQFLTDFHIWPTKSKLRTSSTRKKLFDNVFMVIMGLKMAKTCQKMPKLVIFCHF